MNKALAIKILLSVLSLLLLFHTCILLKIIPYEITWGGRLESDQQMYAFESASITINLVFMGVLAMKGGYVRAILPMKVVNIMLWIFFGLFCLNTLGNIVAETNFEKYFTILTIAIAWLLWKILRDKRSESN